MMSTSASTSAAIFWKDCLKKSKMKSRSSRVTPKTDEWVEAGHLANVNIAKVLSKTYRERRDEVNTSFCTLHNQNCPVEPTDDEYTERDWCMATGGITCKDHSSIGGLSGDGGKHMSGHYCFSEELLHRKNVKAAIAECTKLWGATSMARKLQQKFKANQDKLEILMIVSGEWLSSWIMRSSLF